MPSNLISLDEGVIMTSLFRSEKENILDPEYREQNILPNCETFGREVFDTLLATDGCTGIRIYTSMDENLHVKYIVVGVNENDEDMYIQSDPNDPDKLSVIDNGIRCPDLCPPPSVLNS